MPDFNAILLRNGVNPPQPGSGVAAAPAAPSQAMVPAIPPASHADLVIVPRNDAAGPRSAAEHLFATVHRISARAILHGQIFNFEWQRGPNGEAIEIDPAGFVDGIKQADPQAQLDGKFGGGGYGNKKGDKRAVIQTIVIDKFGAKIIAQPAEGEPITAGWRDLEELAKALTALPLSDPERAHAVAALKGEISIGALVLSGRGCEVDYYEDNWKGKKELKATGLHAPANGNGANGMGGAN